MTKILVTGGAGYIGSQMVATLTEANFQVLTLDNLQSGHRDAVIAGEFVEGDVRDRDLLDRLFETHTFDGVMHFAAHIEVGESMRKPAKYYRNNVCNAQNLLDVMVKHDVDVFIFSSTAAILGSLVMCR